MPDRRARQRRRRRRSRSRRRRRRRPDAHEPEHARAVRRDIERDRRDRPRGRRARLLRRREPERDHRAAPARRHGLRHRPHQPAQDVHDSRTAAAGRAPGRSAVRRAARAVPAGARASSATATARSGSTTTAPKSIGRLRGFHGQLRRASSAPTRTVRCTARDGLQRGVRARGAERELPRRAACATRSRWRTPTALRCTSSSLTGAPLEAGARDHGRSTSPSG